MNKTLYDRAVIIDELKGKKIDYLYIDGSSIEISFEDGFLLEAIAVSCNYGIAAELEVSLERRK